MNIAVTAKITLPSHFWETSNEIGECTNEGQYMYNSHTCVPCLHDFCLKGKPVRGVESGREGRGGGVDQGTKKIDLTSLIVHCIGTWGEVDWLWGKLAYIPHSKPCTTIIGLEATKNDTDTETATNDTAAPGLQLDDAIEPTQAKKNSSTTAPCKIMSILCTILQFYI